MQRPDEGTDHKIMKGQSHGDTKAGPESLTEITYYREMILSSTKSYIIHGLIEQCHLAM